MLKQGDFQERRAADLRPGEIIIVEHGDELPADCFLMKVTNRRNCAFFETTNLTDEKELAKKVMPLYDEGKDEENPIEFINLYVNNTISCDSPNGNLYSFKGSLSTVGKPVKLSYGKGP